MTIKALPIALLVVATGAVSGRALAQEQEKEPSYSLQDVRACSLDAMRLCKDKLPSIKKIESCMRAHYAQLRPKCQARFNH